MTSEAPTKTVSTGIDLIIEKYYGDNPPLLHILREHSEAVAEFALACAARHPELNLDLDFVREAALLHDIGIVLTDAPSIHCHGHLPYIAHGLVGELILETEELPRHARVAARHTGAGLSREDILSQSLPLPVRDYLPETLEEKLVCYADKFFSKNPGSLRTPKPLSKVESQMATHGPATLSRFHSLHQLFQ